ncbi:hypothetical protein [Blautia hydrogenotrophica]|jgi:hypothetical protein|uniref:hypothetical protein n=1 Tax=Blautia hydrogenotrophica TaxID=53443 RepID=UPI002E773B2A|nr:hypothetical protein [Blautia hydrogenotrophica]MEE0461764.1 hypothetical protein [Blautia hydrogenotrophica]
MSKLFDENFFDTEDLVEDKKKKSSRTSDKNKVMQVTDSQVASEEEDVTSDTDLGLEVEQNPEEGSQEVEGMDNPKSNSKPKSKTKLSKTMKKKRWPIYTGVGVLVFIGVSAFVIGGPSGTHKETKKNVKTEQTHKTKATDKKDSHDVLTDKEYKANKETLAAANIGLYLNQDNNLVGTLTFVEGEGKTVVEVQEYSQRTGAIYYKDKDGAVKTYSKDEVETLLKKLKAQEASNDSSTTGQSKGTKKSGAKKSKTETLNTPSSNNGVVDNG